MIENGEVENPTQRIQPSNKSNPLSNHAIFVNNGPIVDCSHLIYDTIPEINGVWTAEEMREGLSLEELEDDLSVEGNEPSEEVPLKVSKAKPSEVAAPERVTPKVTKRARETTPIASKNAVPTTPRTYRSPRTVMTTPRETMFIQLDYAFLNNARLNFPSTWELFRRACTPNRSMFEITDVVAVAEGVRIEDLITHINSFRAYHQTGSYGPHKRARYF